MKTIIIILILVVLISIGAYYIKGSGVPQPQDTAVSTSTSDTTQNSKTFTSAEYGFSLAYPSSLVATTTFASFYHASDAWRQGIFEDKDRKAGTGLVSILVDEKESNPGEEQFYYDAELRVGASKDPAEVKSCLVQDDAQASLTETVNGIPFTVFEMPQAGMSQFADVTSYRTVHDNACYAIDSLITGGGTGTNAEEIRSPELIAKDKAAIRSILDTFSFAS